MPTGIEIETMNATINLAKAAVIIGQELKRLNDKLDSLDYMGTLKVTTFKPDTG